MSQAEDFQNFIKCHSSKRNDPGVWRQFRVVNVLYSWNAQGFYKINSFDFEDGSSLERNIVYN